MVETKNRIILLCSGSSPWMIYGKDSSTYHRASCTFAVGTTFTQGSTETRTAGAYDVTEHWIICSGMLAHDGVRCIDLWKLVVVYLPLQPRLHFIAIILIRLAHYFVSGGHRHRYMSPPRLVFFSGKVTS